MRCLKKLLLPNKLISFKDCILPKTTHILDKLSKSDQNIYELFESTKKYFEDVSEFVLALDVLYALDSIEYNENLRMISYVKKNNM